MFEVGFSELLVIFALALVVLGPERLPKLAAQVGRWIGRAKAMARQFREQLEAEASAIDVSDSASRTQPPPEPSPDPKPSPADTPAGPMSESTQQQTSHTERTHERGA
jgi:sec-independent protein translocase protein TatB